MDLVKGTLGRKRLHHAERHRCGANAPAGECQPDGFSFRLRPGCLGAGDGCLERARFSPKDLAKSLTLGDVLKRSRLGICIRGH